MTEHWLEHAHGRIVAGDDELDVLADYGWVQITDAEREAIYRAEARLRTAYVPDDETAATLRKLLKRLHD
jgi:hypothetical protein